MSSNTLDMKRLGFLQKCDVHLDESNAQIHKTLGGRPPADSQKKLEELVTESHNALGWKGSLKSISLHLSWHSQGHLLAQVA